MGIQCRIIRDSNGNVDYVEAPNGERSQLYEDAKRLVGEEAALSTVLTAYTPTFIEEVKNPKIEAFRQELVNKINSIPTNTDNITVNLEGIDYSMNPNTIEMAVEDLGNGEMLINFTAAYSTVDTNIESTVEQPTQTRESITSLEMVEGLVERLQATGLASEVNIVPETEIQSILENSGQVYQQGINGFVVGDTVYINSDRATSEVAVHEFGHLWNSWMKQNAPEIYNKGINLIESSGQEYIDLVKERQPSLEGEALLEEALAQSIGDNGASIINQTARKSFTEWLTSLWNSIKNTLGLSEISVEDFHNITLEDFSRGVATDLLSGESIADLMNAETSSIGNAFKVQDNAQLTKTKTRERFDYGVDFVTPLQRQSLEEVVKEYEGRVYIVTSDATGVGYDSNGDPIYGGVGYMSIKENVEQGIGFASVDAQTSRGTLGKIHKRYGANKKVAVLVMVQNPNVTVGNFYGAKYFGRGLRQLKEQNPEEYSSVVSSIREFIETNKAVRTEFDTKYDSKGKVKRQETFKAFMDLIENVENYSELEFAEEFIKDTTFEARRNLLQKLIVTNNETRTDISTPLIKERLKQNGFNQLDFLQEYGDNTIFTEEMYRNNTGGFVAGAFEHITETTAQINKTLPEVLKKGINHHQFNGKIPSTGKNIFLDGLYPVNENFTRYAKPETSINYENISREEVSTIVRDTYTRETDYQPKFRNIPLNERTYTHLTVKNKGLLKETLEDLDSNNISETRPNVYSNVSRGLGFSPFQNEGSAALANQAESGKFASFSIGNIEVKGFNQGIARVQQEVAEYKESKNIRTVSHPPVLELNREISREISKAYDQMEHAPNDPVVKASYEAMVNETAEQYNFIIDKGIKVIRHTEVGEPYANSAEMLEDVRQGQLKFLPNEEAFGENTDAYRDNIGLQKSGIKLEDGYEMTNSELFRVVHDYFGHGTLGSQFGPIGEENATLQHASMFSAVAVPAMIAQTRGQNSWVNFSGVNNEALELYKEARKTEREGNVEEAQTIREEAQSKYKFAEPKIGLLPEKYNFTKYETTRQITEQEPSGISTTLESYVSQIGEGRGINRESVQRTERIRGNDVNIVNEYTLDNRVAEGITTAFPRFKGVQKIYEITNGETYRDFQTKALETNKFKASVTVHSAEEYNNMRMFITEDGTTGITLTNDGFLGGAFSDPSASRPNNLAQLMVVGIKEGAIIAEAFDTVLPDYYANFGFRSVSRTAFNEEYRPMVENGALADWDYDTYRRFNDGKPDVVFFIYDGGNRNSIEDRLGQFDNYNDYWKTRTTSYDKNSYEEAYREMEEVALRKAGNEMNELPRAAIGMIHAAQREEGTQIMLSNIDTQLQGQGLGTEMYKRVASALAEDGEALISDFNSLGAEGIWNKFREAGLAETTTLDGQTVNKTVTNPNTIDSNGEPLVEDVIKYIQSKNFEGQELSEAEISEVKNMMIGTEFGNSSELFTALQRGFMPNGVYNPSETSLVNSGLYTRAEARRLLDNEEAQITAYEFIQKLKNTEALDNTLEIDSSYITLGTETNSIGLRNKVNPYLNRQRAIDILGGIKDENLFNNQVEAYGLDFARDKFNEYSSMTKVNEVILDENNLRQKDSFDTLRETMEEILTSPSNVALLENVEYLINVPLDIWNVEFSNVRTLLEEVEGNAIDIGLDLEGIAEMAYDKTPAEVKEMLRAIRNFTVVQNEVTFDFLVEQYTEYFELESMPSIKTVGVPQEVSNKTLVTLDTTQDSYTLFTEQGLLPLGNNLYQRVNNNATLEEVTDIVYRNLLVNPSLLPVRAFKGGINSTGNLEQSYITNEANEIYVKQDIENYTNERSKEIEHTGEVDTDMLKKMVLFSDFFNTKLNNTPNVPSYSQEASLIEEFPKNADYLTTEFIADFNKQSLKEKAKNSRKYNEYYSNFTVTPKGIELINKDPITIETMRPHLTEDLVNHFRLKKDGFDFNPEDRLTTELSNIPIVMRNYYKNFPKALPKFEGRYQMDNGTLITNVTPDFLRTNEGVFEYLETVGSKSLYGRLESIEGNFKEYDNALEPPELREVTKYNLKSGITAAKSINNLYTKKQDEQITNEIDNC